MSIVVRRAGSRFLTESEGRTTRHSFAFGPHYDPANLGFAAIVAHNDELLPPGTGYPDHPHSELEIVTWVLEGALRHTDARGTTGVLEAGAVQRISAGTGIVHAEVTEPGTTTRFLQTWLRPSTAGGAPSYARSEGAPAFEEVIGPHGLSVGVTGARLLLGRVEGTAVLPDAPFLHMFVVDGGIELGEQALGPGDAARMTDHGGLAVDAPQGASLAVWAFGT